MKYLVWVLHFYDESIEEDNVACHCLSRKHAEEQEKFGSWIQDRYIYSKDQILENVWFKDDVDEFVKEYPESKYWIFKIENPSLRTGYIDYSPLSEDREEKLKIFL